MCIHKAVDLEKLQRLKDDLIFLSQLLTIKTKNDGLQPFCMTDIQRDAYTRILKRKKLGKMLKIIFLKARQVGMSTLTEALFFQNTLFNLARNSFVLADKTDSTSNIYDMVRLFYDKLPPALQVPLKNNSSRELSFITNSKYRIGTAGADEVGRSMTINNFHGSEVAFWSNAADIVASMLPAIPDSPESIMVLESTANGTTGKGAFFYEKCQEGLAENSDYLTIFYPWFAHKEYQREIIEPIAWTDEELELKRLYKLTDEQLAWRRYKLEGDYKKREHLFKQEYPICIQEAFLTTSNSLIPLDCLQKARNNHLSSSGMPIIIGVDPARTGDRTIITIRQGRVILKFYKFDVMDNVRLAGIIVRLIESLNPVRTFIDYGHGTGCYDLLCAWGYSQKVELVQFGDSAFDSTKYANRRTEMFDKMREWFIQTGGVFIKDHEYIEEFTRDIYILPDLKRSDSSGKFIMEKKANIVKGTDIKSTDFADSLALTFAAPVVINPNGNNNVKSKNRNWNERAA